MSHHLLLVVDDELETIELIQAIFERIGSTVLGAVSGSEGLCLARQHGPTLILIDIMLPGFSGLELCRRLRDDPITAHIPRVILSACDSVQDRKEAVAAGADRYLVKPVEIRTLIDLVEKLIDQRRMAIA